MASGARSTDLTWTDLKDVVDAGAAGAAASPIGTAMGATRDIYGALGTPQAAPTYVEPETSVSRQAGLTPIIVPGFASQPAATQVGETPGLVNGNMSPVLGPRGEMPNFAAALDSADEQLIAEAPQQEAGTEYTPPGQNESVGASAPATGPSTAAIEAAAAQAASSPANDLLEPTDGQKEAGNYKMGRVRFNGLDISIETPKGGIRRSKADAAEPWQVTMPAHYGYIKGTKGSDGGQADIFIGPQGDNGRFWVINQNHAEGSGKTGHDEHKVVTGVDSQAAAVDIYKQFASCASA